jgi:hypothetical protein
VPEAADPPPAPPTTAALDGLGSDAWAVLLGAARRAFDRVEDPDGELARLQAAPTSRLVGGPLRVALRERLVSDAELWTATLAALPDAAAWPTELREMLATGHDDASEPATVDGVADARQRDERRDAKARVREVRRERDAWRRRAEGAEARADRAEDRAEDAEANASALAGELDAVREQLAEAGRERDRAVERERRRRDAEVARLQETVAELRRAEQERHAERRRQEDAAAAAREAERAREQARRREREAGPTRVVPGRPSTLPAGVAPDTTEAARALLHRGRLVLVDGYNVSKQHRGHLELEAQRTWLVQLLGQLASQRGIRPTVVFDGQAAGGGRPPAGQREVEVRFTTAGITADDELVLAVEGTDEPVVVVTDDRELIARVRVGGADVVGTRSLLGVAS